MNDIPRAGAVMTAPLPSAGPAGAVVEQPALSIEVISGSAGYCLAVNDTRVAGPKPWGGGRVVHSFSVKVSDLPQSLGAYLTPPPAQPRDAGEVDSSPSPEQIGAWISEELAEASAPASPAVVSVDRSLIEEAIQALKANAPHGVSPTAYFLRKVLDGKPAHARRIGTASTPQDQGAGGAVVTDEQVRAALGATYKELPESVQYVLIRGLSAMGWAMPADGSWEVMRAALSAATLRPHPDDHEYDPQVPEPQA